MPGLFSCVALAPPPAVLFFCDRRHTILTFLWISLWNLSENPIAIQKPRDMRAGCTAIAALMQIRRFGLRL